MSKYIPTYIKPVPLEDHEFVRPIGGDIQPGFGDGPQGIEKESGI